jgi:hypothetical protein
VLGERGRDALLHDLLEEYKQLDREEVRVARS